jgi:hypothetical protein
MSAKEYRRICSECSDDPFSRAYRYCPWCGAPVRGEDDAE